MSLQFVTHGNRAMQAILFLHGFLGSSKDWVEVTRELQHDFYCIAVDLPGHGRSVNLSEAADYTMDGLSILLRDVLENAGAGDACLVGYSMGGRAALYFAVHNPDLCSRLILESASPGLHGAADRLERRGSDEAMAIRLETEDFRTFLDDWYRQPLFETLRGYEGLMEDIISRRRENDPQELAQALRGMGTGAQSPLWEHIPTLRMPVLTIAGAHDGKYVEIAERMAVLMPRLRTAIIPNAGHNVHAEHPKIYLDVIKDFLKQPF